MVFHGDYELDFEIYQRRRDVKSGCGQLLGHTVGTDPEDAKARWIEACDLDPERRSDIIALPAMSREK